MINVCIVGAGNISNTRHIPAIKKNPELRIVGIVSDDQRKLDRTLGNVDTKNTILLKKQSSMDEILSALKSCAWFVNEVDACIIGTPPKQHYPMAKASLLMGKHVLVEKPMMMNVAECDDVMSIAKKKGLILNVMHSFQMASGIDKLDAMFRKGQLGKVESIVEIQLSNRKRRLPIWYNELPLGLFYDEAAHFFYSAYRFGNGELEVCNAHAAFNTEKENTPKFLEAQLKAGDVPVQMLMNFNSPICEWGLLLICDQKIAIYDYFKDILIVLNNDGEHYAKDVFKTSLSFFLGFWKGFISNGFKMVTHKLLYGHDKAIDAFANAVTTGKSDERICSELGRKVVKAMNEVCAEVEKESN